MKANEFVKNHGWEYAKGIVIACESGFLPKNQNYEYIKCLVESHELVESYGGIEKSKLKVQGNRLSYKRSVLLSRAILDVESCQ